MKKIFTLAAAAMFACAANAQVKPNIENNGVAQKVNDNLVFYMCAPGDAQPVEVPTVGYSVNVEKTAFGELGVNFQDYNADNTNMVVVTKDYTDPETGAKFPAGYYYSAKVGSSRSYFGAAEGGATGLQNVKKVIFYWAATSTGGAQFSSYLVKEGETMIDNLSTGAPVSLGNRYSMDPNCKITFSVPQPEGTVTVDGVENNLFCNNSYYNTTVENGLPATDWTTFACTQPLKMVLDFTTPIAVEDIDKTLAHYGENVTELNIPYGHYICALRDENGKDKAGDPIAWAADNIIQQGFKRAAYLLGVAIISGNENAKTYYANISNSTDDDECYWEEDAAAKCTPFAAEDEPEYNLFYSWKTTQEFRDMVKANYTPVADAISSVAAAQNASVRYNLAGQQVSANYKGVVIENGKKVIR